MSMMKNLIVGGATVIAADQFGGVLPLPVVAGFPLGKWAVAVAGAWLGEKLSGSDVSWKRAAILGITALAAAELKDLVLPNVQLPLPVIGDGARVAAGALGLYAASAAGVEAKA